MKRALALSLLSIGFAVTLAWAGAAGGGNGNGNGWVGGWNGGGNGGGGGVGLTPAEQEGLIFMREEEKLARDVYDYFDGLYNLPIFANIATSEQRHMDAVLTLLNRYEVPDPAAGNEPGEFTNAMLQALYDDLIVQGVQSLEDALDVGILIEETDIADLEERLLAVVHNDIRRVYQNLLSASRNHLTAFQSWVDGGDGAPSAGVCPAGQRQRARAGNGPGWCGRGPGAGCGIYRQRNCGQCPNTCVRIEGAIENIDPAARQLVVAGTTVAVTENTIIKQNGRLIEFEDLEVGQTVAACGVLDGNVLVANRITVRFRP